ncbi:hypothetical protein [Streptomyces sp. NPDC093261]
MLPLVREWRAGSDRGGDTDTDTDTGADSGTGADSVTAPAHA